MSPKRSNMKRLYDRVYTMTSSSESSESESEDCNETVTDGEKKTASPPKKRAKTIPKRFQDFALGSDYPQTENTTETECYSPTSSVLGKDISELSRKMSASHFHQNLKTVPGTVGGQRDSDKQIDSKKNFKMSADTHSSSVGRGRASRFVKAIHINPNEGRKNDNSSAIGRGIGRGRGFLKGTKTLAHPIPPNPRTKTDVVQVPESIQSNPSEEHVFVDRFDDSDIFDNLPRVDIAETHDSDDSATGGDAEIRLPDSDNEHNATDSRSFKKNLKITADIHSVSLGRGRASRFVEAIHTNPNEGRKDDNPSAIGRGIGRGRGFLKGTKTLAHPIPPRTEEHVFLDRFDDSDIFENEPTKQTNEKEGVAYGEEISNSKTGREIVKLLNKVMDKLRAIDERLATVECSVGRMMVSNFPTKPACLKVESVEDMERFEKIPDADYQAVVEFLGALSSGGDIKSRANIVLQEAINDAVSLSYTMQGKHGKPIFEKTRLCAAIYAAVSRNMRPEERPSRDEFRFAMASALKASKMRYFRTLTAPV